MFCQQRSRNRRYGNRPILGKSLSMESLEVRQLLAGITVDTVQDLVDPGDGYTSLREAVLSANMSPGPDEIEFDFGHDMPATILLQHGELVLTHALTITGRGQDRLTIDAQEQSRIFNITAQTGDFTIAGMTLTRGRTTSGNGGGVRMPSEEARLFIQDSANDDNATLGDNTSGGGVSARWLSVRSSTISGNSTVLDGGGLSAGYLSATSSTISHNSARLGDGGGGIVFAGRKYVSVGITSTITGNSAGERGGGFYAYGGPLSEANPGWVIFNLMIKNSLVANNVGNATPDVDFNEEGTITVEYSLIGDNTGSALAHTIDGMPDEFGNRIGSASAPIDLRLGCSAVCSS